MGEHRIWKMRRRNPLLLLLSPLFQPWFQLLLVTRVTKFLTSYKLYAHVGCKINPLDGFSAAMIHLMRSPAAPLSLAPSGTETQASTTVGSRPAANGANPKAARMLGPSGPKQTQVSSTSLSACDLAGPDLRLADGRGQPTAALCHPALLSALIRPLMHRREAGFSGG